MNGGGTGQMTGGRAGSRYLAPAARATAIVALLLAGPAVGHAAADEHPPFPPMPWSGAGMPGSAGGGDFPGTHDYNDAHEQYDKAMKQYEKAVRQADEARAGHAATGTHGAEGRERDAGFANLGEDNAGIANLGKRNTGVANLGTRNTGVANVGKRNAGMANVGRDNTGVANVGDCNTGIANVGDRNTGIANVGDRNTGIANVGDRNTGIANVGDRNTGIANVGDRQAGIAGLPGTEGVAGSLTEVAGGGSPAACRAEPALEPAAAEPPRAETTGSLPKTGGGNVVPFALAGVGLLGLGVAAWWPVRARHDG